MNLAAQGNPHGPSGDQAFMHLLQCRYIQMIYMNGLLLCTTFLLWMLESIYYIHTHIHAYIHTHIQGFGEGHCFTK